MSPTPEASADDAVLRPGDRVRVCFDADMAVSCPPAIALAQAATPCGVQIVSGVSKEPRAAAFQPNYEETRARLNPWGRVDN